MNDFNKIKDVLQNFEVEYDPQDWIRLEKDLPKPGISSVTKTILVASTIVLTVASVILLSNIFKNKQQINENNTENIAVVDNNINNSNIITENTNNDNTIDNESNPNNNTTINNNNNNSKNNSNNTNSIEKNNIKTQEEESDIKITGNTDENNNETNSNFNNRILNEENPDLSNVVFKYEISDKCVPVSVSFIAENIPENCEVIWNTGDNSREHGQKIEYIYLEDGLFYPEVSIIYKNSLLKNKKLKTIELFKPTNTKIIFDNSENLYYFSCENEEELEYLWSIDNQEFRESEVSYKFNKTADYTINLSIVNQFGCKSDISEHINVVIEHIFYLPNAFKPNSNGVNSEFGPIGENMNFNSYQLLIVDGNGKLVFNSNNVDDKWNGKINNIGKNAKPGYYLWEVKTIDEYGNIQTKKGRVNLIWN